MTGAITRRREPGWWLAAMNDLSGRRGIYYRATPPLPRAGAPYVLEVCGGREGDDYYGRFDVPADGPLRAACDALLGCLQTGAWMLEARASALPAAMSDEVRAATLAYLDREDA